MEAADGCGVLHRWISRRSYSAHAGGRQSASTASLSIFLAERRTFLFLPAMVPKGRQYNFAPVPMPSFSAVRHWLKWSYGGPIVPSGVVPGDSEIAIEKKLVWTRSHFMFFVWGPLCKG